MAKADFRFYAELNYFLPPSKKQVTFAHFFQEHPSIKDTIESLGVPHPEVKSIVVNGKSVDFSYQVQDGDTIGVYPLSQSPDIAPIISLQPQPLAVARFVLDIHLGKLANSLRMLGFDTLYRNDYGDEELAYISSSQERILLTRDLRLLMRSIVTYGYYVRSTNPQRQIVEVLSRFDLLKSVTPFQRCIRCNGSLESVSKESIIEQLPPLVRQDVDKFHRCIECRQIYWKGTHVEKMQEWIDDVLNSQPESRMTETPSLD